MTTPQAKPDNMTSAPDLWLWRERILTSLYGLGVCLGLVVLAVSAGLIIKERLWGVLAMDLTVFAWAVTGFLGRRRISYPVRAWAGLAALYLVGAMLLFNLGPISAAPMWLFTFAVAAAFFLGLRVTVLAVLINAATLAAVGGLIHAQALPWLAQWPVTPQRWWVLSVNIIMLNALVASGVAVVFRAVTTSLAKEGEAVRQLEQANQGLREQAEQRQAAEKALRESEERYRLAFATSPDAVNINQMDGTYVDINQGFTELTGYTRADVIGRPSSEIGIWNDPADRQRLVEGLAREGRVANLEAVFRMKDGRLITALMSATIITLDGQPHILSITRAIEEQRKAREALAQSEERYRSLVENVPYGLFLAELPLGGLHFVNDRACRMFGYELEEARRLKVWDVVSPDEHAAMRESLGQYLRNPADASRRVYTGVRKDGSRLRFEVTYALVRQGQQKLLQGFVRDVTEIESLERQLRHAQKMEAVGTLTSGIAHDFNNILQAVGGYAQLVQERTAGNPELRGYLEQMLATLERAAELVKRLLTFSRKVEPRLEPVDLDQVVASGVRLLQHTLPKMITIVHRPEAGLPPVLGDFGQLEQVVLNLGANAGDAMPDGGRLEFATSRLDWDQAQRLLPAGALAGEYVRLSVTDTGQGMDEEVQKKMFEPFFTTKAVGKGTGLGLAVAYGILQNHGGFVSCASQPGQGATFDLFFPALAKKAQPQGGPAGAAEAPDHGGEETLLLADDEPGIRASLGQYLRRRGYQVLEAGSGEEALAILAGKRERVDLVVLDLGMPGMGGLECLRRLRQAGNQVAVMVASGYAPQGPVQDALQELGAYFIPKPFRLATMLGSIRAVLDQRGAAAGEPRAGRA
ncbi:MAG: PAS domain-containing hybrid sensor histidine kinase/response regulator [Thermodesulfobacteriota bacterium]